MTHVLAGSAKETLFSDYNVVPLSREQLMLVMTAYSALCFGRAWIWNGCSPKSRSSGAAFSSQA
jgi:hypothetical protein